MGEKNSELRGIVAKYQRPSLGRALWQCVVSIGLYGMLWFGIIRSLKWSHWIAVGLAVLAGMALVRVFIIFHDCGHRSFFSGERANHAVGFLTGLLALTPYWQWRWEHAGHHAGNANLDRRGMGDIWTMTLAEYESATPTRRRAYRFARNPWVLFGLAPTFMFFVRYRIPSVGAARREKMSVWVMNGAVLAMAIGMSCLIGFWNYLLIQFTITAVGGAIGFWLFYIQHQFEDVYWKRPPEWDFNTAAMEGSSYYKLPRVLQWLTGNIGFHHIHHLSPRIPNYNLERCHRALPLAQTAPPLTLRSSLKSLRFRLWDEANGRLVGFPRAG